MKKAIFIGVIVILGFFLIGNLVSKDASNVEKIKIGIIAPQVGGGAPFGVSLIKGIEMAHADYMKSLSQGGKVEIELVIENDEGNAAKAASASHKLIEIDKVKAILTVTGVTGNTVKPIAEAAGILHLADSADPTIGSGKYNYTYSIIPTDEMNGWLKESQSRGNKTIAVIYQKHPGILPSVKLIEELAPKYGMKVVYSDSFETSDTDLKTISFKASKSDADIYFVASYPPQLDLVSKDLMAFGKKNISTYSLFAISPTPELYNGKWYTDAYLSDVDFAKRFVNENPETRFNVRTAPYGYDMFNIIADAINSKQPLEGYAAQLSSYNGKVGKTTKDAWTNNFRSSPAVWEIQNGTPVLIKGL